MSKESKRLSYWAELNRLWEASGLPQEQFCKEQGVVYKQFVYWRAQVLKRGKKVSTPPKLMAVIPPQQPQPSTKVPLAATAPSALEVKLPSGVVLHIKSTSDIDKASALLRQLGGGL